MSSAMIQFLARGGPIMIPILLCSIIALAIIIERLFSLRVKRIVKGNILREVEELLRDKKLTEANALCRRFSSTITRILQVAILNHDKGKDEIKTMVEDAGRQEMPVMERYLNLLGTLAAITPLLGLLGTVRGMILAFDVIAAAGVGDPRTLAGGISEALFTTAFGLSVAIPTLVFHGYFVNKVDGLVLEMEKHSLRLLDILKR